MHPKHNDYETQDFLTNNTQSWMPALDIKMLLLHHDKGKKWIEITSELGLHNDSLVKNHFYAIAKKTLKNISTQELPYSNQADFIVAYYFANIIPKYFQRGTKETADYLKTLVTLEKLTESQAIEYKHLIECQFPAFSICGWKKIAEEYTKSNCQPLGFEFPSRLVPLCRTDATVSFISADDRANFASSWLFSQWASCQLK